MNEKDKLERLRNVAEASAKSGLKDHKEFNIPYSALERSALSSLFMYFTDNDDLTDQHKDYFLTYFKEAWTNAEKESLK